MTAGHVFLQHFIFLFPFSVAPVASVLFCFIYLSPIGMSHKLRVRVLFLQIEGKSIFSQIEGKSIFSSSVFFLSFFLFFPPFSCKGILIIVLFVCSLQES